MKPGRTSWLWVLILAGAVTALFGFMRAWAALNNWDLLRRLNLPFNPVYLPAGGILWLLLGLAAVAAIFARWRHGPWLIRGVALTVAASYWADRLLFTRSDASRTNQAFAFWFTLLAVGGSFLILLLPDERRYFQARPERTRRKEIGDGPGRE